MMAESFGPAPYRTKLKAELVEPKKRCSNNRKNICDFSDADLLRCSSHLSPTFRIAFFLSTC